MLYNSVDNNNDKIIDEIMIDEINDVLNITIWIRQRIT